MSLIDMDITQIEPTIQELNEALWQFKTTRERQYTEKATMLLDVLALRHIYFQQFALDWKCRLSRALIFEQYTEDMLRRDGFSILSAAHWIRAYRRCVYRGSGTK